MGSMDWRAGQHPDDDAAALIPRVLAERAIFPVYQPIVDLDSRALVGVEAKLDMHLLRHPHAAHTIETASIASAYAERTGAIVLAEGIETEADLLTAQALGARWGRILLRRLETAAERLNPPAADRSARPTPAPVHTMIY